MNVPFQQRGVVVVIALASAGRRQLTWLYRGLERAARFRATEVLGAGYAELKILTRSPDAQQMIAAVHSVASKVDVIDLVLVVHGEPKVVVFSPHDEIAAAELGRLLNSGPARGKLRMLYSTACFGRSHAEAMVEAGVKSAVGAIGQNTNGVSEFEALLRRWVNGETIESATKRSDQVWSRKGWDLLARVAGGFRSVNSEKAVIGRADVTIDT